MNTSDVLNRAADLIEERGWARGNPGFGDNGGPVCLEGGILAALGFSGWFSTDPEALWTCPAYIAVANYLDRRLARDSEGLPVDPLWRWNDNMDRTAEQVITTLRAAAVIEAAKETADERAEVSA